MEQPQLPGETVEEVRAEAQKILKEYYDLQAASRHKCEDEKFAIEIELIKVKSAARHLLEALEGIIDIGKRNTTNPKYDGFYTEARAAIEAARKVSL